MKNLKKLLSLILCIIMAASIMIPFCVSADGDWSEPYTENYTVHFDNADDYTFMRYAPGNHTTASAIKNAEGCIGVGEAKLKAATKDGVLTYEMPDGGIYSFWIRRADGSERVFAAVEVTNMTHTVDVYGVNVTLNNVYGIKDFFIDKGTYTSYKELKENGYTVMVSETKLAGKKSYTYTLKEEGDYTLLIRYKDTNKQDECLYFNVDCTNPTFEGNGLQLTVGNLEGVKCIRTAYGQYSSVSAIKKAPTHRAFTAKGVIMDEDKYTVQYRDEGTVTVSVQYENGYTEFYEYNVQKKQSSMTLNGDGVTFTNLDGLVMIRYARGTYSTASEIKNAPDAKYVKSDAIVDGSISLKLDSGRYSFYVQYDDDSYNFYTVTVPLGGEFTKNYGFTMTDGTTVNMNYWLYTPENATVGMPLIVVLHSAHTKEEEGRTAEENLDFMVMNPEKDDIQEFIYNGEFGDIPAYIVMPQTNDGSMGWKKRGDELEALIDYCKTEYGIDTDKVSAIGYSLGATGIHEVAASYPGLFDRVLTVAGGLDGVTNYIRPYIDGKRIDIPDGSELSVQRKNNPEKYEPERMKFAYAEEGSRFLTVTPEEKEAAAVFEKKRVADIATMLSTSTNHVWTIVGSQDAEVVPHVAKDICGHIPHMSTHTILDGYNHEDALYALLEMRDKVKEYLCQW